MAHGEAWTPGWGGGQACWLELEAAGTAGNKRCSWGGEQACCPATGAVLAQPPPQQGAMHQPPTPPPATVDTWLPLFCTAGATLPLAASRLHCRGERSMLSAPSHSSCGRHKGSTGSCSASAVVRRRWRRHRCGRSSPAPPPLAPPDPQGTSSSSHTPHRPCTARSTALGSQLSPLRLAPRPAPLGALALLQVSRPRPRLRRLAGRTAEGEGPRHPLRPRGPAAGAGDG